MPLDVNKVWFLTRVAAVIDTNKKAKKVGSVPIKPSKYRYTLRQKQHTKELTLNLAIFQRFNDALFRPTEFQTNGHTYQPHTV